MLQSSAEKEMIFIYFSQGEEEAMFLEYRKLLKILFQNIGQLVCNSGIKQMLFSPNNFDPILITSYNALLFFFFEV